MHNIKDIRKNFDEFKKFMKLRNVDLNLDNILSLDENNRNLIGSIQKVRIKKSTDFALEATLI